MSSVVMAVMVARTSIAASGKRLGAGGGRAEDTGGADPFKGVGEKDGAGARVLRPSQPKFSARGRPSQTLFEVIQIAGSSQVNSAQGRLPSHREYLQKFV